MKNGSGLSFILLVSTIFVSAILIQSMFSRPPAENLDAAKLNPAGEVQQDGDQSTALKAEPNKDQDSAPAIDTPGTATDADHGSAPTAQTPDVPVAPEVERESQDEFVQMGSLANDGSDRYLVTINKRAGTIHRVELNFRNQRNGRFKYRDLVWKGGYLGSLACEDTPDGCRATLVGKGTPAQIAGIESGDIIVAVNGEPVVTAAGFDEYLNEKTKPQTTVEVEVKRNGTKKSFDVELTQKPLSVIRPESDLIDQNFIAPESFVLSLIKPMQEVDKAWPDLDGGMRNANWQVTKATDNLIELEFKLSEQRLAALGFKGPITVLKRYRIPALSQEEIYDLSSRSFHLELEIEVQNNADVAQRFAYELDGPTGLTAETWWYANKIHGRQTAVFYMAGARDVIGSTNSNSYIFYGNPELIKGAQKTQPEISYLCKPLSEPVERQVNFAGVDSHYFNVSLLPKVGEDEVFEVSSLTAYPNNRQGVIPNIPKNARLQKLVDCTFQMVAPIEIPANGSTTNTFEVFCGPKDIKLLTEYGLGDARTFGWFSWCSMVLLKLLHFFYWITGSWSYGLSIIMLTVLVRCLMIPFSRKAALNAQMMQHLAPQMKEITEKYKEDMEKRAAAQRELYKKHNFNPFGGCFMMFFQLPIFYGLYKALNVDIALRDQPLVPGMEWCSNLAAPDKLMFWKDWMPTSLGDETGWLGPYLNILPLITMVLFIAQQKLFTPPPTDDNQKMMHKMMTFMMIAMGVMFFKVPAGLCLYFITSSLWGIIERKLLPKPVLDTDKLGLTDGSSDSLTKAELKAQSKLEKAERIEREKREAEAEERRQRNAERKKRLKKRDSR